MGPGARCALRPRTARAAPRPANPSLAAPPPPANGGGGAGSGGRLPPTPWSSGARCRVVWQGAGGQSRVHWPTLHHLFIKPTPFVETRLIIYQNFLSTRLMLYLRFFSFLLIQAVIVEKSFINYSFFWIKMLSKEEESATLLKWKRLNLMLYFLQFSLNKY